MFNALAFLLHLDTHKDLPHISKYHRESYAQHVLLVVAELSKLTNDSTLLVAACLHDIAKPRTQGINKIDEPCFYGHEEVSDEELAQFLSADDSRFQRVKALILCHMTPYKVLTAADYDKTLRKSCQKTLRKAGMDMEVDEDFIHDLTMLHDADDAGSVRKDEDLKGVNEVCMVVADLVRNLQ